MRPGEILVFRLRRLRHDFELRDGDSALAERGADAVRPSVATADHDYLLASREDRLDVAKWLAGDAAVLLRQEVHGEMDTFKLAAGDCEVTRMLGAAGEQHRIVVALELPHGHVAPDIDVAVEGDAFGRPSARRAARRWTSPS